MPTINFWTLAALGFALLQVLAVLLACWQGRATFRHLQHYARRLKSLRYLEQMEEAILPPLTLLIPLHHEKEQSVQILKRLFQLEYPQVDYLVICNAGEQLTFEALRERYGLKPVPRFPVGELLTRDIKGVYQSEDMPQLWVIDKQPGSLADALNAGLNFCQTPLVATVNTDIYPQRDALLNLSRPFLESSLTWSVTGRVRFQPGSQLPGPPTLPTDRWGRLAVLIQRRRDFLLASARGRSPVDSDMLLWRRASLVEAGGFSGSSNALCLSETLVSLRRLAQMQQVPAQLHFLPDTLAWKAAPKSREAFKDWLYLSQQAQKVSWRAQRQGRVWWYSVGEPLLFLLNLLALPLLAWPDPRWLLPGLLALYSPVALWQLNVLLGELTSQRYSEAEQRQLQRLSWLLPLLWLPALALWQLRAWLRPPPAPARVEAKVQTSPLKQTARLQLDPP